MRGGADAGRGGVRGGADAVKAPAWARRDSGLRTSALGDPAGPAPSAGSAGDRLRPSPAAPPAVPRPPPAARPAASASAASSAEPGRRPGRSSARCLRGPVSAPPGGPAGCVLGRCDAVRGVGRSGLPPWAGVSWARVLRGSGPRLMRSAGPRSLPRFTVRRESAAGSFSRPSRAGENARPHSVSEARSERAGRCRPEDPAHAAVGSAPGSLTRAQGAAARRPAAGLPAPRLTRCTAGSPWPGRSPVSRGRPASAGRRAPRRVRGT